MKKVSNKKPPQWILDKVSKWGVEWGGNIIFTYAPNIHTSDGKISDDLYVHESTHLKQQGDNPKSWWEKYLTDKNFRFSQELEAYQKQWEYAKLKYSRTKQLRVLQHSARVLSSKIYGNIIKYEEAIKLIQD